MKTDNDIQHQVQRIEKLVRDAEAIADVEVRGNTIELVRSLMDFHGAGLARIIETIAESGNSGKIILENMAEDELVSSLLLIYGLHPASFEDRVLRTLATLQPYLSSHGGTLELLSCEGSVLQMRLSGSCGGCGSSAATVRLELEDAIRRAVPDLEVLEIEGAVDHPPVASQLVQLSRVRRDAQVST